MPAGLRALPAGPAGAEPDASGRRYLIALQATLGSRHAPHPLLATDPCVQRIGASVDGWLAAQLG